MAATTFPLTLTTSSGFGCHARTHATLRRAAVTLAAADDQQVVPSAMLNSSVREFDLSRFKGQMAREILAATRDLGWPARSAFDEQVTSPYTVWRHLEFQRFKIAIRDAGIEGLNRTLPWRRRSSDSTENLIER